MRCCQCLSRSGADAHRQPVVFGDKAPAGILKRMPHEPTKAGQTLLESPSGNSNYAGSYATLLESRSASRLDFPRDLSQSSNYLDVGNEPSCEQLQSSRSRLASAKVTPKGSVVENASVTSTDFGWNTETNEDDDEARALARRTRELTLRRQASKRSIRSGSGPISRGVSAAGSVAGSAAGSVVL